MCAHTMTASGCAATSFDMPARFSARPRPPVRRHLRALLTSQCRVTPMPARAEKFR